jgi:hypothetical protein
MKENVDALSVHQSLKLLIDFRLVIAVSFLVILRLWLGPFITDDAYITFRYAENLAGGVGFVYNVGQFVCGTTTPLYALALAAFRIVGADIPTSSFILSVCADAVTAIVVYTVFASQSREWAGTTFVVFLSGLPRFLSSSLSGMETSVYIAMIAVTLYSYAKGKTKTALALGSLLVLVRPDGLLLVSVLVIHHLLAKRRIPTLAICISLIPPAVWAGFSWAYFGSIVPTSVSAKANSERSAWNSIQNLNGYFASSTNDVFLLLLATVGILMVLGHSRRACSDGPRNTLGPKYWPSLFFLLWTVWGALYVMVFALSGAFREFFWYYAPLVPLLCGLAMLGLYSIVQSVSTVLASRFRQPGSVVNAMSWSIPFIVAALLVPKVQNHYKSLVDWRNGREALYLAVAEQLNRETEEDELLAASEIGALGYVYKGPVYDTVGLVSPEAIGKRDLEKIQETMPRWVVSYNTHIDRECIESVWFRSRYTLVDSIVVNGERALVVYGRV